MAEVDMMRMLKLSSQGFQCAQIMLILAMESEGKTDADLVRAMGGLNVGLSDTLGPCGAMTGGCCLLSYFAGKGDPDEMEDPAYKEMLSTFTVWFRDTFGGLYGGHICSTILAGDRKNMRERCPSIVSQSFEKAMQILQEHGVI